MSYTQLGLPQHVVLFDDFPLASLMNVNILSIIITVRAYPRSMPQVLGEIPTLGRPVVISQATEAVNSDILRYFRSSGQFRAS